MISPSFKKSWFASVILTLFACHLFAQHVKSPDEFLGYPLGTKYTPHHKIVSYFKDVAATMPGMMHLEQYGETNEGRPLLLAFISTEDKIKSLEEIRKNNLRLSGLLNDKPADLNAPAIVWLSYNVHGNETSSSEVSMKVLYELLNPSNAHTKDYLKNTVVIIDPCLNPDGRDRYVNWVTQVMGKKVNPLMVAREHHEPWPGGRTNHYNFDLNRDWVWQTQVESKARIAKYNEWMPQVHSDYHEQGYNDPYYFAPAAEPYHEVISPFQRKFQVELGRNHSKYFDANGWLYFTKEVFDLLYPSYGDTYPVYNGSIGMTFEQAGLSRASTAVITNTGDTLTLNDRIAHHFTTSMSTLEYVSKNTGRLMEAYKLFFDNAVKNGVGDFKSFVITDVQTSRIDALKKLLDANGIQYQYSNGVTLSGYNYFTGKTETFTTNNSMVVSTLQPHGVMAKVLFEPNSKLADSATYDITAWSLPYVYGLQTYGVKEKVVADKIIAIPASQAKLNSDGYGLLVRYNSFEDSKILAALLSAGIKIRFASRDFTANGARYKRGTLVILKKGNEEKMNLLNGLLSRTHADVSAINTGFMDNGYDFGSDKVRLIKAPKVALVTGDGVYAESAGEVWNLFDEQLNYPITLINNDELSSVSLKNMDVLILSAGQHKILADKEGNAALKAWVKEGGKIIALDQAAAEMAAGDWNLKFKKDEEETKGESGTSYADLKKFAENEHDGIKSFIAGAIYRVDIDTTHPLCFGMGNQYYTLKQDDHVYEYLKSGWNAGVFKNDNYVAGFVGSKIKPKIKDSFVFGEQQMGDGCVVYLTDNPIFRNFWESGKLLLANAVFLSGQ